MALIKRCETVFNPNAEVLTIFDHFADECCDIGTDLEESRRFLDLITSKSVSNFVVQFKNLKVLDFDTDNYSDGISTADISADEPCPSLAVIYSYELWPYEPPKFFDHVLELHTGVMMYHPPTKFIPKSVRRVVLYVDRVGTREVHYTKSRGCDEIAMNVPTGRMYNDHYICPDDGYLEVPIDERLLLFRRLADETFVNYPNVVDFEIVSSESIEVLGE